MRRGRACQEDKGVLNGRNLGQRFVCGILRNHPLKVVVVLLLTAEDGIARSRLFG